MAFVAGGTCINISGHSLVVRIGFRFRVRVAVDAFERCRVRLICVAIAAECPTARTVHASGTDREERSVVERRRLPCSR